MKTDANVDSLQNVYPPSGVDLVYTDVTSLSDPSVRTRKRHDEAGPFLQSPGLREIARYGGYQAYRPPGIFDSWVFPLMKVFDPDLLSNLRGFTRRGEGIDGMYKSLFNYSADMTRYTDLSISQRASMKRAIAKTRDRFKLPVKHQPLDWHQVGQYMRTDTSAGVTFPGKRKGEVMAEIYGAARWLAHRMKQDGKGKFDPTRVQMPPCLAGSRGHLSPADDVKTRLVWIYPAEMLVIEGQYAPVLYRQYMSLPDSPLLLGKSAQRLYTEWLVNRVEGEFLVGLDFSSFDTKVPSWLVHTAFDIIHENIEWETFDGKKVTRKDRQKWRNVWDAMKWYFINTPILMPDGRMFRKYQGVPSGSWFTQLVDSIVNHILVTYIADCQSVEVRGLKVLGDDSAFRSPQKLDLARAQRDSDALGMILKPEKCEVTEDPTEFKLLGTKYRNSHQHRTDEEWFKLLLYPEQPPPDIGTSMTRLVGLWLGGAMFSTRFCEFFELFQTSYECPTSGWFSKDQKRWLEIVYGTKAPRGWTVSESLFWKSIFYVLR
nr:MAG: putative RNA-dependent RNA polymerase [Gammapartitivirus sp.]